MDHRVTNYILPFYLTMGFAFVVLVGNLIYLFGPTVLVKAY